MGMARFQASCAGPVRPGEDAGEARGELMLAVNDLMHALQREFLK